MLYPGSITDIPRVTVGSATDPAGMTGCTAVMFDTLVRAGADVRGGGPGTINTDILSPETGGCVADCIMLAGGSAFGLGCVDGAMRYLEERGRGFPTGIKNVPMVPGAIIYDLGVGDKDARPDARMGYIACENACKTVLQGSFGAGTGATVGKVLLEKGMEKSGQGTASITLDGGLIVGALVVVNALGDVYEDGRILRGVHDENGKHMDALRVLERGVSGDVFSGNTTIGVIATNASLRQGEAKKLAMIAHDGYAMAIRPVHTMADGDTVFSAATGDIEIGNDINRLLAIAAEVMRRAVVNAVESVPM